MTRSSTKPTSRIRPQLEALEDRLTPSSCSNPATVLHVGANETYTTINAALTVAKPGNVIKVDAGTYVEQLNVTVNNVKLEGSGPKTIIEAPTTLPNAGPKALIDVNGATGVTIQGFTIEGNPNGAVDSLEYGVRVDHGGSATIADNHITNIRDNPLTGGNYGVAIQVGKAADSTTGSAKIYDNLIDGYQKVGIEVDGTGSHASIRDNQVIGAGPTSVLAQNGIQISRGANARVEENFVTGNVYSPGTTAAVDILLFNPGKVSVEENLVEQNDYGIYVQGATNPYVSENFVTNSSFTGIVLDTTTGAHVKDNFVVHNGFGDSTPVPGDGGIFLFNSTNNSISHNVSNGNNGDGIVLNAASTGNTISHNSFKFNTNLDIDDFSTGTGTGGTGNTYKHNHFRTANVTGLS
jgi:parallel beta-helix repeat protein